MNKNKKKNLGKDKTQKKYFLSSSITKKQNNIEDINKDNKKDNTQNNKINEPPVLSDTQKKNKIIN